MSKAQQVEILEERSETGAGTGVGSASALALARRGCSVLLNYNRSQAGAERTAEAVRALGVKALPPRADGSADAA